MKKTLRKCSIGVLLAAMLLGAIAPTHAQKASSNATVEFEEGTGPTAPVDPDNPNQPDPDGGKPIGGSLAIVKVSDFHFGTIPVRVANATYNIVTEKPHIQIVDLRGTGTGWELKASLSEFESGGEKSLKGANILINYGLAASQSLSDPPSQYVDVVLASGAASPVTVIKAQPNTGMGLWVMRWYPEDGDNTYIQLEIPAGQAARGSHAATIDWILEDTP